MVAEATAAAPALPPLRPALAAMTGLQALVALALSAPGVLAPRMGIDPAGLGLYTIAGFAVGMAASLAGGVLAGRLGGGLVGRLGWGLVAARWVTPRRLVALLGIGMAAASVLVAPGGAALPFPALLLATFLLGLTASGWNGVFLAEVARLAPPGRIGEATGAVMVGGFVGLIAGPLLLIAVPAMGGLGAGYVLIGLLAALAGLSLLGDER